MKVGHLQPFLKTPQELDSTDVRRIIKSRLESLTIFVPS